MDKRFTWFLKLNKLLHNLRLNLSHNNKELLVLHLRVRLKAIPSPDCSLLACKCLLSQMVRILWLCFVASPVAKTQCRC